MSSSKDVTFRIGENYLSRQGRYYRRKRLNELISGGTDPENVGSIEHNANVSDSLEFSMEVDQTVQNDCVEHEVDHENWQNEDAHCGNFNDLYNIFENNDADDDSDTFVSGMELNFNDVDDAHNDSEKEDSDYEEEDLWDDFYAKKVPLKDDISHWYMKNVSVTKQALNQLLRILRKHGIGKSHDVPADSRTLIKIDEKIIPTEVSGGESVFFGLERCVRFLHKNNIQLPDNLQFDINVDGAQVFNNPYCNISIWPILTNFTNIKGVEKVVLPVSILCCSKKPTSLDFLYEFIQEYENIRHGLQIGSRTVTLSLNLIRLDIPAHSFLCSTISHNGYFSCFKCKIKGEYYSNKVIFPVVDEMIEKRTNEGFRNQEQPEHHVGESILLKIKDLDMVNDIPIDPMHNVYLGVTKRQIWIWLFSQKTDPGRLSDDCIAKITSMIKGIKGKLPVEFHRNLRSLDQLKKYKAKELRMFLLYIGPFVLKNYLSPIRFAHFMRLHSAIKILSDSEFSTNENMIKLADHLLQTYRIGIESLYDKRNSTYNLHLMSHLHEEVRQHGPLDRFSNFIFENFLGFLKTLIRSPNAPLKQMSNRYNEIFNYGKIAEEKLETICSEKNQKLIINGITLTNKFPNSIVLLKSREVFRISKIEKSNTTISLKGKKLQKDDYFSVPIKSSTINCFQVRETAETDIKIDHSLIAKKMVPFQLNDTETLVIPMTIGFWQVLNVQI